jgi:hypothetical protein
MKCFGQTSSDHPIKPSNEQMNAFQGPRVREGWKEGWYKKHCFSPPRNAFLLSSTHIDCFGKILTAQKVVIVTKQCFSTLYLLPVLLP